MRLHVVRKPSHDFIWGIVWNSTQTVIGQLEIFDVENDRMGTVGYRIDPRYWNQGMTTEALQRAVDFIFTQTSLDRLHAQADVRNLASNRVLEKCGFQLEGTIRHGKLVPTYCNYNIWGLLRSDYEQQHVEAPRG